MNVPRTTLPSEKEFLLLLQDRAFVDYFNVFLSLPVFGQRILYRYHDRAFSFDPPLKKNKGKCYPDRVVDFLRTERYQLFLTTALSLEYQLCLQLRNIQHEMLLCHGEEQIDSSKFRQLLDFLIGHVIGMQYFRRSLLDTTGHDAYCCWLDLEKFRIIPETDSQREEQFRHIKARYFVCGAPHELARDKIMIALTGLVNFEVLCSDTIPDHEVKSTFDAVTDDNFTLSGSHSLRSLQTALITALKCYWLPRYVNHILQTTPSPVMSEILRNEWNLETDSACLHVKILFEHLFPRHELELADTTSPSVAASTDDSQLNMVNEITDGKLSDLKDPEDNERMKIFDSVSGSCGSDRTEKAVDILISETISIVKQDLRDQLELQQATSLACGDGFTRRGLTDSGDLSDTNSRESIGYLWTPFSASMGDTLNRSPTYYSRYSQSSTSTEDSTPYPSQIPRSKRPIGAGGNDRCQRTRKRARLGVKLDESRPSEFQWQHDAFERIMCFYIHGSAQRKLSFYEKQNRRFIIAMGAETLAGFPFRAFLSYEKRQQRLDCLDFWEAIREYLCVDNSVMDGSSQTSKSMLATKITERFLLESSISSVSLSAHMKQALYLALIYDPGADILYDSQSLIIQTLRDTWREYRSEDRQYFISSTCWKPYRRFLQRKQKKARGDTVLRNIEIYDQRRNMNATEEIVSTDLPTNLSPLSADTPPPTLQKRQMGYGSTVKRSTKAWPELQSSRTPLRSFTRSSAIFTEDAILEVDEQENNSTQSEIADGPAETPGDAEVEGDGDEQVHRLDEQHQKIAFQLAVACLYPQIASDEHTIADFIINLEGNYGSLTKPTHTQHSDCLLRMLTRTRTYDVANLKVARIFLYETPAARKEVTFDAKTFVLRKNGYVMPRPPIPKEFKDVLAEPDHLEYFRRYLSAKKADIPLKFWLAVEAVKETRRGTSQQTKIMHIVREYFSKHADFGGGLKCNDDIIKQVSFTERVSIKMMLCAQAAVFRSMERRWYFEYLDSYPMERECAASLSDGEDTMHNCFNPETAVIGAAHWILSKTRYSDIRRSSWLRLARLITGFIRCTKHPIVMKLFDMYLRIQLQFEAQSGTKEYAERSYKTTLNNRLIVLNKLPRDLAFWIETTRYKELFDSISGKGTTDQWDSLKKKSKAIIDCFLASDVLPRLQINVVQEIATAVITLFQNKGPIRSIFHESTISLFPILYHYWKICERTWELDTMSEEDLESLYERITNELYRQVNVTPHRTVDIPCYLDLTPDDYHTGYGYVPEENHLRMNFTLMNGLRVIYPFTTTHGSFTHSRTHMSRTSHMSHHKGISRVMSTFIKQKRDSNMFIPMISDQVNRHLSPVEQEKESRESGRVGQQGSLASLSQPPTIKIEDVVKTKRKTSRSRTTLSAIQLGTATAPLHFSLN